VFGLLGWGPGVGLSGVRPSHPRTDDHYPCAHYDDYDACAHYDDHDACAHYDDHDACAHYDDHDACAHYDEHDACAHYDDHDACAHYDDHHDAPVAARSHTVSEWDPSEWVWMSCESSSPAVLQGGGVADVYLSLGWGTSDGDGAAVSEDHNHNDYYHYSGDYYHYGGAVGVFERVVVEPKAGVAGFNR